jgi:hypothetical protein
MRDGGKQSELAAFRRPKLPFTMSGEHGADKEESVVE